MHTYNINVLEDGKCIDNFDVHAESEEAALKMVDDGRFEYRINQRDRLKRRVATLVLVSFFIGEHTVNELTVGGTYDY